jgi:hypothetical protein
MGVETVKITGTSPSADYTLWRAPSAGCLEVQKIFVWRDPETNAITGRTIYTPESIVAGEPDPSIFGIPDDYVERSPWETTLALMEHKYGGREAALKVIQEEGITKNQQQEEIYERLMTPPNQSLLKRLERSVGF